MILCVAVSAAPSSGQGYQPPPAPAALFPRIKKKKIKKNHINVEYVVGTAGKYQETFMLVKKK